MRTVIFTCFTPYQLFNSIFYSMNLREANRVLIWQNYSDYKFDISIFEKFFDEIIIIPYYMNKGLFKKQFSKCLHSGFLFLFSKESKVLNHHNKCKLIVFSDQEPTCHKHVSYFRKHNNEAQLILVEEGFGLYNNEPQKLSKKVRIIYGLLGIRTTSLIGDTKNITAILAKHIELFKRERFSCDRFIPQSNIFRNSVFIENMNVLDNFIKIPNCTKKIVLYLGIPFEEIGITYEEYKNSLIEFADNISDRYDIVVKPHPREDINIYKDIRNIHVFPDECQWIPFEIISVRMNIHAVVTTISYAAFNLYEINPSIKIIYTYKHYKGIEFDSSSVEKLINYENIYFSNSLLELVSYIDYPLIQRDIDTLHDGEDIIFLNKEW